jgi:hypothetical protein
MGVTKKPLRVGSGAKRWTGEAPATYTNYGRNVPSKHKITADLIKISIKLNRFAQSGKASDHDMRWAVAVGAALDKVLIEIGRDFDNGV